MKYLPFAVGFALACFILYVYLSVWLNDDGNDE
jgi:hypothetical protein